MGLLTNEINILTFYISARISMQENKSSEARSYVARLASGYVSENYLEFLVFGLVSSVL